jgi:hypothetical protein
MEVYPGGIGIDMCSSGLILLLISSLLYLLNIKNDNPKTVR